MDNFTLFDNIFDVNEDDLEEDRELKLITAPAIAGEMIDLDKASLQLSSSAKNATATKKEERRRRKKEREERRRRKNKRREKNRKGQKNHSRQEEKLSTIQPTRESTLRELGPNFDDGISTTRSEAGFPTFAELRGRPLTVSRFGNYDRDDRLIWMMDTQFRRRGRRHRNRSKDHEAKPRVEARDPYSGAKEDTYYDKVKLFDILKNNDDEEKTNQV